MDAITCRTAIGIGVAVATLLTVFGSPGPARGVECGGPPPGALAAAPIVEPGAAAPGRACPSVGR
ncbi:MAG TPA: hypothetical protein VEA81_04210 [Burkholderiaceae bacterium]|nr:hypothetical protein [Burkholderiaceae bacterium]